MARERARGFAGGLIPVGMQIDEVATRSGLLARGTSGEQIARALGQAAGGMALELIGMSVALHGGGMGIVSGGQGAAVAVPEMALGTTLAVAGVRNAVQATAVLMMAIKGPGAAPPSPAPPQGAAGGPRAGMGFTRKDKRETSASASTARTTSSPARGTCRRSSARCHGKRRSG